MSFRDVQFLTPFPSKGLSKGDEETVKDWLENYRPVRQRTMRSETTKDKAEPFPRQHAQSKKPDVTAKVSFAADQDDRTLPVSSEINALVSDVSLL